MTTLKQFLNLLLAVLIFSLVPIVLFIFVTSRSPMIMGIRSYVVVTGSMKPALPIGSMVFTIPKTSYKVGDIITFKRGIITVTHRIYDVRGNKFVTKGDANTAVDSQIVTASEIVGRDVAIVPFIGRLTGFIKTPFGFGLLLGIPTLLFVLFEAWQMKKEWEKIIEKRVRDNIININPFHKLKL